MFLFVNHNVHKIIGKIYKKVFKEKVTLTIKTFFQNLTYVVLGYGVSAIFIFIFQIIAGRVLGPQEYGKYALIDSTSAFLYIFMTFGISTAAIKYNSEKEDYLRQQKIISSSYFTTLIISFIFALSFFIFSGFFSKIFSIPLIIFRLAIFFAISFALYVLAMDNLSGLHKMKKVAFFRAIYGFLMLFFLAIFLFFNNISFTTVALITSFVYLVIFLLITANIRNYLYFEIDKTWVKNLLEYGLYAAGGSFLLIFLPNLSKIMVNKFLTLFDVGIFNAYYFSSLSVVILFNTIFVTVFFPTASKHSQKSLILNKIKKVTPILFLIGVPILFLIQFLVLKFFGRQYMVDYLLMLLFSVSGIMFFLYSLYVWLFYSKGVAQARRVVFLTVLVFIINILLNFYLIPKFLLRGAVVSLILTYLFGWLYLVIFQKRLID